MIRTIYLEIPTPVLRACGAPIRAGWEHEGEIEVELHYIPDLTTPDGPYFEGTVDGTWKDNFEANDLPREWREKALEKWSEEYR